MFNSEPSDYVQRWRNVHVFFPASLLFVLQVLKLISHPLSPDHVSLSIPFCHFSLSTSATYAGCKDIVRQGVWFRVKSGKPPKTVRLAEYRASVDWHLK